VSIETTPRPVWARAAFLAERLRALREGTAGPGGPGSWDARLGQRELESWRAQPPFDADDWFERRLASDGIEGEELCELLGEDDERLAQRMPAPDWAREVEAAYAQPLPDDFVLFAAVQEADDDPGVRFLELLAPLVVRAQARLREELAGVVALADGDELPFEPDALADLWLQAVPSRLFPLLGRVMVLELHVARMEGRIEGATPAERFEAFAASVRRPETALRLLGEYPLLARRAVELLASWVDTGVELARHLAEDWALVRERFGLGADAARLTEVQAGAGDAHEGGRSVVILGLGPREAPAGAAAKLVYKPRSLAADAHFQELLAWLNERGDHPPFRVLEVLDRGDHGWLEFVDNRPCADAGEVQRFFRRQGAYLALLYGLEATDFHFENLIACGEHPVLVDLETLFHGRHAVPDAASEDVGLVYEAVGQSVLRVGLLPQRVFDNEEFEGVDISGLTGVEGQLSPDKVMQWDAAGTDEMRITRERVPMLGGQNLPTLGEAELSALDHREDVLEGFRSLYRLLERERDALLAEGGPLRAFADDRVRSVLRPTHQYARFLGESSHPDFLRDALEYERFCDRLWVAAVGLPALERVIPHERRDLFASDVPVFFSRPASRDLWTSDGTRLADFWPQSGLELVERRLAGLGDADLKRQLWLARGSLATLSLHEGRQMWPSYPTIEVEPPASRDALLERVRGAARDVGRELSRQALRGPDDMVAWMGLVYVKKLWKILPLEEDFYAGMAGVIHYLAYQGAVGGDPEVEALAKAAWRTCKPRFQAARETTGRVGAFAGLGGLVYGLAHWGALWGDEEPWDEADRIVEALPARLEQDDQFDVIGGTSGLIGGLLAFEACRPSERTRALLRRASERLYEAVQPQAVGVGWPNPLGNEHPITGFSHGASGVAWALTRLYEFTGEERFLATALEAVRYERSQYDDELGEWKHNAETEDSLETVTWTEDLLSAGWCYGSPGVGLARLRMLPHTDEAIVREDVVTAVEKTLRAGFGSNHCLCHGDLGNLDFVYAAARALGDDGLLAAADHVTASVLASIERDGWVCGVPLGVDAPAMLNGLAGIGYGLLRVADPARVPSLLALEPPHGV